MFCVPNYAINRVRDPSPGRTYKEGILFRSPHQLETNPAHQITGWSEQALPIYSQRIPGRVGQPHRKGGSHIPECRQVPSSPHFHVWRQDF